MTEYSELHATADDSRRAAAFLLASMRDDNEAQVAMLAATAEAARPLELIVELARIAKMIAIPDAEERLTEHLMDIFRNDTGSHG